jgi:O-antigen chain-terminating methyltransferase
MIEMNIDNLSVEELIEKIKVEVEKRKATPFIELKTPITMVKKVDIIEKNENVFQIKEVYEYSDFTKFHDVRFIENIFRGLLKRDADKEGLEHYLNILRSGEKSKSEIISIIRFSAEGRSNNVSLLGFNKRFIQAALYKIPVIGHITKSLVVLFTLPKLLKRLNMYENYVAQESLQSYYNDLLLEQAINTKADEEKLESINHELQLSIDTKVDEEKLESINHELQLNIDTKVDEEKLESINHELQLSIDTKADKENFALYLQTVHYAKEYMKISQKNMQNLIDEVKERLPHDILNQKELLTISEEEKHKFDTFYVAFEDKFRGTREDIKQRVKEYLPYIEQLSFNKEEIEILDIGCGRGEWIELLGENGYKSQGIDLNRVMIAKSKELGLCVEEADVIEYLEQKESNSLFVITGFHIIEHLPFEVLMKMYEEAYRVLKPGGMVIFETPNPENLVVGACNFYTDPTHLNPLVPESSKFVLENSGFQNCQIKRINLMKEVQYIDDTKFSDINDLLYAVTKEQDYAIIGFKE